MRCGFAKSIKKWIFSLSNTDTTFISTNQVQHVFSSNFICSFDLVVEMLLGSLGQYKALPWQLHEWQAFNLYITHSVQTSIFVPEKEVFFINSWDQNKEDKEKKIFRKAVFSSKMLVPHDECSSRQADAISAAICSTWLIFPDTLLGIIFSFLCLYSQFSRQKKLFDSSLYHWLVFPFWSVFVFTVVHCFHGFSI